jgi:hypothetical protein
MESVVSQLSPATWPEVLRRVLAHGIAGAYLRPHAAAVPGLLPLLSTLADREYTSFTFLERLAALSGLIALVTACDSFANIVAYETNEIEAAHKEHLAVVKEAEEATKEAVAKLAGRLARDTEVFAPALKAWADRQREAKEAKAAAKKERAKKGAGAKEEAAAAAAAAAAAGGDAGAAAAASAPPSPERQEPVAVLSAPAAALAAAKRELAALLDAAVAENRAEPLELAIRRAKEGGMETPAPRGSKAPPTYEPELARAHVCVPEAPSFSFPLAARAKT